MNINDIITKMKHEDDDFPYQELLEAASNPSLITPNLLEIIKEVSDNKEIIFQKKKYKAHLYAMFLLAQFQEKEAYPFIINFFVIHGRKFSDFGSNVVTEYLPLILASTSCGDTSLIKRLIENDQVDTFIRGAGIRALTALVVSGKTSREDVMYYYQSLFRSKLERKPSHLWDQLIYCCTDLYPKEVLEDIENSYELTEFYEDTGAVKRSISLGKEKTLKELYDNYEYSSITDAVSEIKSWYCFYEKPKPFLNPNKKIGRNDLCICGSKKKYKKCCGKI